MLKKKLSYIELFKLSNAVSEETSKSLLELNIKENFVFNKMIFQGFFIEKNNKYYLNEEISTIFMNRYGRILKLK
ncbi:hypothetical protein [Clostridium frigidicarnis]|uniref:hypothetical protein n=1 Tax=Clostridium frigidicarnis TaxID=84698 RepID=UPI000B8005FF|nr:hypothetical protein [Clostridium frigidicarnis]